MPSLFFESVFDIGDPTCEGLAVRDVSGSYTSNDAQELFVLHVDGGFAISIFAEVVDRSDSGRGGGVVDFAFSDCDEVGDGHVEALATAGTAVGGHEVVLGAEFLESFFGDLFLFFMVLGFHRRGMTATRSKYVDISLYIRRKPCSVTVDIIALIGAN